MTATVSLKVLGNGLLLFQICLYSSSHSSTVMGAQWLSGRVLDSRPRGHGFEPHQRHCVMSLSKIHVSLLRTGSTQEDPSRHS